jgi:peptide/nickel transport system substrate-binding protein
VSNAEIDAGIKAIQVETDPAKRQALISKALGVIKDQYLYIPLHQQVVVWAARSNIDVVQMADNFFPLRFVTVK